MPAPKPYVFVRTSTDQVTEEIITVLADGEWIDFKPLADKVYTGLRQRKAGSGSAEVLRLRCHERLTKLVHSGLVEKKDKAFRGLPSLYDGSRKHAQSATRKRLPSELSEFEA